MTEQLQHLVEYYSDLILEHHGSVASWADVCGVPLSTVFDRNATWWSQLLSSNGPALSIFSKTEGRLVLEWASLGTAWVVEADHDYCEWATALHALAIIWLYNNRFRVSA